MFLTEIKINFSSLSTYQPTGSEVCTTREQSQVVKGKEPVGAWNFNPHHAAYMQIITFLVLHPSANMY